MMECNKSLTIASCYETEKLPLYNAQEPLLFSNQQNKWTCNMSVRSFAAGGILIGMVDQVIFVGTVIFMSKRWGEEPHPENNWDAFLYIIFLMLSRVDILTAISITIILKLTDKNVVRNLMGKEWTPQRAISAEHHFLAGILLGSFCIWIFVVIWTPLPLPMIAELTGIVAIDLVLFYFVIRYLAVWRCGDDALEVPANRK